MLLPLIVAASVAVLFVSALVLTTDWLSPTVSPDTSRRHSSKPSNEVQLGAIATYDLAEQQGFQQLMKRLDDAIEGNDALAIAECFDFERMAEEASSVGIPGIRGEIGTGSAREMFVTAMRSTVGPSILKNGENWKGFRVHRFKMSSQRPEAELCVRREKNGSSTMLRYWVVRQAGTWRLFDQEHVNLGLKTSTLIALMLSRGSRVFEANLDAIRKLQSNIDLLNNGNAKQALNNLQSIADRGLPPQIVAALKMLIGASLIELDRPGEALPILDEAIRLHPDLQIALLLRARALSEGENPESALACIEQYEKLLSADGTTRYLRGLALWRLARNTEAIDAVRSGLLESPTSNECFSIAAVILHPHGDSAELVRLLNRVDNKQNALRRVFRLAVRARLSEHLGWALDQYRANIPTYVNDAAYLYTLGQFHVLRGELAEAMTIYEMNRALLESAPYCADVFPDSFAEITSRLKSNPCR